MKESSRNVFNYLKANYGTPLTNNDIATALGVSGSTVVGSVQGLVRKGYAIRTDDEVTGQDGKVVKIKHISLTEAGLEFNPDAETEAK